MEVMHNTEQLSKSLQAKSHLLGVKQLKQRLPKKMEVPSFLILSP